MINVFRHQDDLNSAAEKFYYVTFINHISFVRRFENRIKDQPDRDRLALRFERFKAVA